MNKTELKKIIREEIAGKLMPDTSGEYELAMFSKYGNIGSKIGTVYDEKYVDILIKGLKEFYSPEYRFEVKKNGEEKGQWR